MMKLCDILYKHVLVERKLRVFDFDDTLASTRNVVKVRTQGGGVRTLNSDEFAHYVAQQGDKFDFSNFSYIVNPTPFTYTTHLLRAMLQLGGDRYFTVLTARPKNAAKRIKSYLKTLGFGDINVVALQSSDPYDKAKWIKYRIEQKGYNDIVFVDDSIKNIQAVSSLKKQFPNVNITTIKINPSQHLQSIRI